MKGIKSGVWMVVLGFALQTWGVELIRPRAGERFAVGGTLEIRWSPGKAEKLIRIELRSMKDRSDKVLAANVPASQGAYSHSLRGVTPGEYRILLRWRKMTVRSRRFVVYSLPDAEMAGLRQASPLARLRPMAAVMAVKPRIFVTHPGKWQWVTDNQSIQVWWKIVGAMPNRVKIAAVIRKYNQAEKVFPIAMYVPNSGAYTWKTSPLGHSQDSFQIRVTTMDGKVNGRSEYFYLSSSAELEPVRQVLVRQHLFIRCLVR